MFLLSFASERLYEKPLASCLLSLHVRKLLSLKAVKEVIRNYFLYFFTKQVLFVKVIKRERKQNDSIEKFLPTQLIN